MNDFKIKSTIFFSEIAELVHGVSTCLLLVIKL
jgi:hypothetical protein